MAKWFYKDGQREIGPVEAAELRRLAVSGKLPPSAAVRREDIKNWMPASRVQGLFGDSKSPPQPTNAAAAGSPVPLQTGNQAAVGVHKIEDTRHPKSWLLRILLFSIPSVGCLGAVSAFIFCAEFGTPLFDFSKDTAKTAIVVSPSTTVEDSALSAPDPSTETNVAPNLAGPDPSTESNVAVTKEPDADFVVEQIWRGSGMGISQDKCLKPTTSFDTKAALAKIGFKPVVKYDDSSLRVWEFGPSNRLAFTGFRDDLTGIFLFTRHGTDQLDSVAAKILMMTVLATLDPYLDSGDKWVEGDDLVIWLTSIVGRASGSNERIVNGKCLAVTSMSEVGYLVSVVPLNNRPDTERAFRLLASSEVLEKIKAEIQSRKRERLAEEDRKRELARLEEEKSKLAEVKAHNDRIQSQLKRVADSRFGAIALDPSKAVELSKTMQDRFKPTIELRGSQYAELLECHSKRDWLSLINLLNRSTYREIPYEDVIGATADVLLDYEFRLLVRIDSKLLPAKTDRRKMFLMTFPQGGLRDRKVLSGSAEWTKHPEDIGFLHEWKPSYGRTVIVVASPDVVNRKVVELNAELQQKLDELETKRRLGEMDESTKQAESLAAFKQISEKAVTWALSL